MAQAIELCTTNDALQDRSAPTDANALYLPLSRLLPSELLTLDPPGSNGCVIDRPEFDRPKFDRPIWRPMSTTLADASHRGGKDDSDQDTAIFQLFQSPAVRNYLCGQTDLEPVICTQRQRPYFDRWSGDPSADYHWDTPSDTFVFAWIFDHLVPNSRGEYQCQGFDSFRDEISVDQLGNFLSQHLVKNIIIPEGPCWLGFSDKARHRLTPPKIGYTRKVVLYTYDLSAPEGDDAMFGAAFAHAGLL